MDNLTQIINSPAVNALLENSCTVCGKPIVPGRSLCFECKELDIEYAKRLQEHQLPNRPDGGHFNDLSVPRVDMGIVPAPSNAAAWIVICGFLFLAFIGGMAFKGMQ